MLVLEEGGGNNNNKKQQQQQRGDTVALELASCSLSGNKHAEQRRWIRGIKGDGGCKRGDVLSGGIVFRE